MQAHRLVTCSAIIGSLLATLAVPTAAENRWEERDAAQRAEFRDLVNPVPSSAESIKRGRVTFMRHCMECHGPDAKAQIDAVADATDLTEPELWYSGTTPGEVFRSIREGSGEAMPPYKDRIRSETDTWHMVNYIVSLWPEEYRPEPVEAPEKDGEESSE